MSINRLVLFLLLYFSTNLLVAQRTNIEGKVFNDSWQPVKGVMLMIKGTKVVATSGANGSFAFTLAKFPDTLVFLSSGYERAEYTVTEKNRMRPVVVILHTMHPPALKTHMEMAAGDETKRIAGIASTISRVPGYAGAKIAGMSVEKGRSKLYKGMSAGIKADDARSQILTAGEVSDFKKWKLWEDYTDSEFAGWSRHWGLAPNERYCVQVQNQERIALVGEKVYLVITDTRDTVWQAVTDNTGKAELWGNVFKSGKGKVTYSLCCQNFKIASPTRFEQGINRITLTKACAVSGIVDIAFVVDATGSMGDEIHYLQQELQDVIGKTAARYKEVSLRSAAVFYRDHSDEYLTRHIDFKTDPFELIQFIKHQAATGGGDYPEAVEHALTTALDSLSWNASARSRILFLVLDAPPHDQAKDKINVLMSKAAKKGIRIVPVVCSGVDKSTEYLMRSIALVTNGSYVFLTDDSGVGNSHIKPTTDEFKVELLNDLLQRLTSEMIYVPACGDNKGAEPVKDLVNFIKVSVYPNPSTGLVNIEIGAVVKEILITDFTGKVLMRPAPLLKKGRLQIDLGNYPSGTYLVKYFIENRGWGTAKFVVTH